MAEKLFSIGLEDKQSGERFCLRVWASNPDEATAKINELFGADGCYRWTGTGPTWDDDGKRKKGTVE